MDDSIPLAHPIMDDEMIAAAQQALRDELFLRGESVAQFEHEFAEYIGTNHAIALDSGTRSLHLALEALGIGEGDAVITTPATFIATANAIIMAGAEPVFADISAETYTIDPDDVKDIVENRDDIAAIIPVHLYGYPADMNALGDVSGNIPIISDACQAHGAKLSDRKVGSIADLAAFSFYPSKNMTVGGDGGMVTTDDNGLAERLRALRDVGRSNANAYEHEFIGYTARLNTVNAAIGRVQLSRLDEWNRRRAEIADTYSERFSKARGITCPPLDDGKHLSAWYLYAIRTRDRDKVRSELESAGIETGINYAKPVHLQKPYRDLGFGPGDFPISERWAEEVICLPIHQELSEADVNLVTDAVIEATGLDG